MSTSRQASLSNYTLAFILTGVGRAMHMTTSRLLFRFGLQPVPVV